LQSVLSLRYQRTSQMQNVWFQGPPPRLPLARISHLRDLVLTTCLHDPAGQEANWPRCVKKHSLLTPSAAPAWTPAWQPAGAICVLWACRRDGCFSPPPVPREFGYPCAVGAAENHTQSFCTVHPACAQASHTRTFIPSLSLFINSLDRQL
jgi:hypothetical protein